MNKKKFALLEKAFSAEINAAIANHPLHFIQSNSKLADVMVDEGYLARCKTIYLNVVIDGYELTHFGRMTYCVSCDQYGDE